MYKYTSPFPSQLCIPTPLFPQASYKILHPPPHPPPHHMGAAIDNFQYAWPPHEVRLRMFVHCPTHVKQIKCFLE